MKKRTIGILLALTLCLGFCAGALATDGNETISAILNRKVKISYNGEIQNLKDGNGVAVYPLTYNGTTYLPVRAVAGLLGLPVDFDSSTDTVLLGTSEKQPSALVSKTNSGTNEYSWIIRESEELKITGDSGIQEYQNGIAWKIWNGSASVSRERVLYFDLSGHTEISFTAWSDIAAKVYVYDQDYNVLTSFELTPNALTPKTVNIAGASKIAFGANGPAGSKGMLKILDATVK